MSSGLKVNNAVDDAQAFFLAKNLNNRAADLQAVKDDIGQAASSIGAAQNGIEAISNLSGQLQGIATAARGGSAQDRAAAAEQFDSIRQQIDNLARDAGFNGVNLIASTPSSQTVSFNESGSSDLTITGGASDTAATSSDCASSRSAQSSASSSCSALSEESPPRLREGLAFQRAIAFDDNHIVRLPRSANDRSYSARRSCHQLSVSPLQRSELIICPPASVPRCCQQRR